MKKILVISMFMLLAAFNVAIITDINEGFNLKLNSLLNMAKANSENDSTIKMEQDFYDESGNCYDYDCILGEEIEMICTCDVEYAWCFVGQVDNCFVTGVIQTSEPYDCNPNGFTGLSCSGWF